jgi:hypothetical protein
MNHSLHSADRTTHLKIVALALAAGIAIAGTAISTRLRPDTETAAIIKAGKPVAMSNSAPSVIR